MNLKEIASKKRSSLFWVANIITAILCYGFELTNGGITVDDEMINSYLSKSGGLISSGRYGLFIINSIFKITYLPFFYLTLGLILIILGNHIYTSFFRILSHDKFDETASVLFSIAVLSAPAYMYKMIFQINTFQMGIIYLCAAFTVIFMYKLSVDTAHKDLIKYAIASIIMVCFCVSNNETTIVDIAMMFLFALLLGNSKKISAEGINKTASDKYIKPIIKAGVAAIAGLILWKISAHIIIKVLNVPQKNYIGEYILYNKNNFVQQFLTLLKGILYIYKEHPWRLVINIIMAGGLATFCITPPPYTHTKHNEKIFRTLIFLFIIILSFFMPLVTGNPGVLLRTKTYTAVFYGICMSASYIFIAKSGFVKKSVIKILYFIIFLIFVFYQAREMNFISYDIYNMSQYDYNMVYNIYNDIQKISDDESLPVVFIGVSELYRPFGEVMNYAGINSIFSYGDINPPYRMDNSEIYSLFSLMGLELKEGSEDVFERAYNDSIDMEVYPIEGSIMKTDYAIIVKLGEASYLTKTDYSNITTEDANERITLATDFFEVSDNLLKTRGWAFMDKNINGKKCLLIDNLSDNSSYILTCTKNFRNDVTKVLNDGENHDNCGFNIRGYDISQLSSGEYRVRLAIYNNGVYYISDYENSFVK